MQRLKTILKKVFFLPPAPTVLIAVPSFIFVFIMLSREEESVLSYVAYLASAYAMILLATGMGSIIQVARGGFQHFPLVRKIKATSWGSRLLGDSLFRSAVTLHGGLAVNLLYTILNFFSGVRYRSTWFMALAFYYVLLSVMRAILVRYVHCKSIGEDMEAELRHYRICGVMLLVMNQALVGVIVYMLTQNRGFSYPGYLIYAMALYTFYITIIAIVNVIRFRKQGGPVMSAAKVINLTAALVSMISLETAMLAQFGEGEAVFRQTMLGASGGAVCVIVLTMAIYMIVSATKRLRFMNQREG